MANQVQAPAKGNNTGQKTDEELLAVPEMHYGTLTEEELDRLDKLQKGIQEPPPTEPEKTEPEPEKKEEEKKEEKKEEPPEKEGEEDLLESLAKEKPKEEGGEEPITFEDLAKKKGWNAETAKDVMAKSYVHMEKRASKVDKEIQELRQELGQLKIQDEVNKKVKELADQNKRQPTEEEVKDKMMEESAFWHEILHDPEKVGPAINSLIGFAVKEAVKQIRETELKPFIKDKEDREQRSLSEEVQKEYESVIQTIGDKLYGGVKAKAEIFFKNITPEINKKFSEYHDLFVDGKMKTDLQNAPGALKLIVSEIIMEKGLFPGKKTKLTIDTGDGTQKAKEEPLTSEKVEKMTPQEIAKLSDEELDKAIEREAKARQRGFK